MLNISLIRLRGRLGCSDEVSCIRCPNKACFPPNPCGIPKFGIAPRSKEDRFGRPFVDFQQSI